ncbi:hypothetical protein PtB15_11B231 [Puccinia triticina]|nr:hypothetical protein PtB15_11B231 [Puccinia triticina]
MEHPGGFAQNPAYGHISELSSESNSFANLNPDQFVVNIHQESDYNVSSPGYIRAGLQKLLLTHLHLRLSPRAPVVKPYDIRSPRKATVRFAWKNSPKK